MMGLSKQGAILIHLVLFGPTVYIRLGRMLVKDTNIGV